MAPVRTVPLFFAALLAASSLTASDTFEFKPANGTRFVRTLTRTGRIEFGGMVRTEATVFVAEFKFTEIASGYRLVMTPVSFRYLVNDHETESPVWALINGRRMTMLFNAVGKLTEARGYEDVDEALDADRVNFSPSSPSMHLDHLPIAREERQNWDGRILLWLSQPSRVGTHLQFDSSERGFTGERVRSHTSMKVLRAQKCGTKQCVATVYTMVPDLTPSRQLANETGNVDLLDLSASEMLEQVIEPGTMMPHYQKLTWKMATAIAAAEEEARSHEATLTAVSEFIYRGAPPAKK
jgi:hypothetical protein